MKTFKDLVCIKIIGACLKMMSFEQRTVFYSKVKHPFDRTKEDAPEDVKKILDKHL